MADVLERLSFLLVIFAVVFGLNVVPAFAPPTWTVLSFIAVRYDQDILLLALTGASGATLGRVTLAKLSNAIVRQKFLRPAARENIDQIKTRLEKNRKLTFSLFLLYAFGPLPSNYLFIAYGLTALRLRLVAVPFFLGRIVGYTFWAFSASTIARKLAYEEITTGSYFSVYFVVTQAGTIFLVYVFTKIDWRLLLSEKKLRWRKRPAPSETSDENPPEK